jgi:hypothetical protein
MLQTVAKFSNIEKLLPLLVLITACSASTISKRHPLTFEAGRESRPDFENEVFTLLSPGPGSQEPSKEVLRQKLEATRFELRGYRTSQGWRYTYDPVPPSPLFCSVLASYLTIDHIRVNFVTYSHVVILCSQLYPPESIVAAFARRFDHKETEHLRGSATRSYFPSYFRLKKFSTLDYENAIVAANFFADHFDKTDETGPLRSHQVLLGKGAVMRFAPCL